MPMNDDLFRFGNEHSAIGAYKALVFAVTGERPAYINCSISDEQSGLYRKSLLECGSHWQRMVCWIGDQS